MEDFGLEKCLQNMINKSMPLTDACNRAVHKYPDATKDENLERNSHDLSIFPLMIR